LVGDAVHSNTQEWLLKNNQQIGDSDNDNNSGSTLLETMLFTNFFGAICSFIVVFISGDLIEAVTYCQTYTWSYPLFFMRSCVIYGGVLCLMSLFQRFDAVVGTIITTLRKVITIIASFLLFPKPMSLQYLYGLIVFIIAVTFEVRARQMPARIENKDIPNDDEISLTTIQTQMPQHLTDDEHSTTEGPADGQRDRFAHTRHGATSPHQPKSGEVP